MRNLLLAVCAALGLSGQGVFARDATPEPQLLEHISVHRYYRGIELQRPVSWEEAVESWRENVYKPMVERILIGRTY